MKFKRDSLGKRVVAILVSVMMTAVCLFGCGSSDPDKEASVSAERQERLQQLKKDAENGLFILINKQNSVSEDYCAHDLSPINYYAEDRDPQWRYMRAEAADSFHKMVEAARAEGIDFVMTTAYRSYGFQSILWNNAVERYGTEEDANNMVARPGESEHQSGLAVDISSAENDYQLNENFGDTEAGKWVAEYADEYGFILRYPADKTDITGYGFEPWHLRYVGVTAAEEISGQGVVLEEYIETLKTEGVL